MGPGDLEFLLPDHGGADGAYQFLNSQNQHVGLVVIALYAFVLYRMVALRGAAPRRGFPEAPCPYRPTEAP